jgi:RNA recognition motif-containing protein
MTEIRKDFSDVKNRGDRDLDFNFDRSAQKQLTDVAEDLPQQRSCPTSVRVESIEGETAASELKKLFKPFGRILEVGILESRMDGNRALISATITFSDTEAARNAARELDGFELRGLPVRVSVLGESEGKDVESY